MSDRISLVQVFTQGLRGILDAQSQVYKTQNQLSSGKRVLQPSDDPAAAAQILQLNQAQADVAQYKKNIDGATNSLEYEDTQLSSVTTLLTRVRELAVQAGDGSLTKADRQSLATELSTRMDELAGLANTRNASGEYIFAGFQGQQQPFVQSGTSYQYVGDSGQRLSQISSSTYVPINDNGSDIFVNVASSRLPTSAAATNTGSATIAMGQVVNQAYSTVTMTGHVPVAGNQVIVNGVTFTYADAGAGQPDSATVVDPTHVTVSTDLTTAPTATTTSNALVNAFTVAKANPQTLNALAPLSASAASGVITIADTRPGMATSVGRSISFAQGAGATNFGGTAPALVLDGSGYTPATYQISINTATTPSTYQVDTVPATTPVAAGNYVSGQPIKFMGAQVDIVGTPGNGDTFVVGPPSTQDVFTTLNKLTQGLNTLSDSADDKQRLADLISESLDNLDGAQDNISRVHAKIGARLNTLESTGGLQDGVGLVNSQVLSQVRDLDYSSAISQLSQENLVLQAAQQSFAKISNLSLFDFLK